MENTVKEQKERLQQLALRLGLTIRDIARIADMSEATLYHVTDETRIMSGRTASKICYHLERVKGVLVNRDWLLNGDGEMFEEKHNVVSFEMEEEKPMLMVAENEVEYGSTDWKAKYLALMEDYVKLQKEHSELLKKMLQ